MGIIQKILFLVLMLPFMWDAVPSYGGLNLTILYDNSPYLEGITEDWGFSCLITAGREKIGSEIKK